MTNAPEFDPFAGGEILLTAPTTEPQQEIWLAVELGGRDANLAYNESLSVRITGAVDAQLLAAAVNDLVVRHEALRSTFTRNGESFVVEAASRSPLVVDDLRGLAEDAREQRRQAIVSEETLTPFDLERGPLFRPRLILLDNERSELVLTAHHLVCDGWSTGVLVSELPELYAARAAGRAPALPEASKFSDYAVAERRAAHGGEAGDTERYWLETLGRSPAALDLPTDFARPLEGDLRASREDFRLDPALVAGLRQVGKSSGASLMAVLFAGLDAFLYRLTGQTDFVIAMPSAGQAGSDFEALVGHCVNTLPIRVQFDPDAPFVDHVRAVKRAILDGSDHQRLSFGSLIKKLDLPRTPGRVPLAPVIFNLDRTMPPMKLGAASGTFFTNPRGYDNFELFINGTETDDSIVLEMMYRSALFRRETVLRWLSELRVLLEGVVAAPDTPLGRLPVLPEDERQKLVKGWNQTALPLPDVPTALELIEAQVKRTPQAVAVRDERGALTYLELDQQANHVAHQLRELGIKRGDCVGVCLDRHTRTLVGLLAVWKAGGAYVPLDPDYPAARLAFVLEDAAVRVLLTEHKLGHVLPNAKVERVFIDQSTGARPDAPARDADPRQLAYILHTSGSTGKPKGVQIEQRSFLNLLCSLQRWPGMSPSDVLVAVTTLSFDMAGVELFLPLTVGAQVVIASREAAKDANALSALISASGATVVQATPVTWRFLVEAGWRGAPGFRVFTGGEPLAPELAAELWSRTAEVWNLYGPTETTVYATGTLAKPGEPITIGGAVANSSAYIMDRFGQLVPTGARGELYVGGLCVARGYLNRPDLTAERFVKDPFSSEPGAMLYRTGDVVRHDAEGKIIYEGRNDHQVKVRGFRIELGEIESALNQHPTVRQSAAAVHTFGANDARIVAYVVAAPGNTIDSGALLDHLRGLLPPYMLPQHTVVLDAMPLTPNGKIDRKALPAPDTAALATEEYIAPNTDVQQKLAEIWRELLHVSRVGLRDGFFDLGGHSMLAVRMLNRVRDVLGIQLPAKTIFQAQTIEALSAHVELALSAQRKPEASSKGAQQLEEVEF